MIRKITLVLLSLGFVLGGVAFVLNELNLATGSGDQDHIYAALFGGGLLGFIGVVLFIAGFRKREDDGDRYWAVGGSTLADDSEDYRD
ncbi:MAG: hypothetical protein RIA08_12555 [Roseovarius sp.]|uniref:hypothetical protein n=1 Tax=Roseovarius sp. TaxID=1486281 RepID=UPI0032EC6ED7